MEENDVAEGAICHIFHMKMHAFDPKEKPKAASGKEYGKDAEKP
ncbi:hypothetical protein [Thermotalea metallivorans]|uniref:Uncharacterized protein n=1 Tax=Thermotalea metallivorans TaxID=520762 RepID=A0A140LA95_9FIRM|nr:hypothetical protein [Thermotalea metallivorans]KXG77470.1 hypothetical protein AN619_04550 [Thermotalea metallivorans]